jgi:MoaA/NifB/PqqE/SkfB family radical SAM enzyme
MRQGIPFQVLNEQILALFPNGDVEFVDYSLRSTIEEYNSGEISSINYKNYILSSIQVSLDGFYMPAPLIAFIEITNLCNLECKHCYANSRHRRLNEMSTPMILKLLDEFNEMGVLQVFLTGGEIFTHKDALDIIRYSSGKNFTTQVFTNGILLNERIISQIPKNIGFAISFDTASPERTVRGKMNYPKLKETFDLLRKYNLAFRTAVSVHKNNINDIEETFEWCISNGYPRPQWLETFPTGRALKNRNILLDIADSEDAFSVFKKCMDKYCKLTATNSNANYNEQEIVHSIKTIQMVERLEIATRRPKLATTMAYVNSSGEVYPDSSCLDFEELLGGNLYSSSFYKIWHNGFGRLRNFSFDDFKFCRKCPISQSGIHCHFRDYGLAKNITADFLGCGATDYTKSMIINTDKYWSEKSNSGYKLKLII